MNHVDFGRLIARLRREHEDEDGLPWTQGRLAQEVNRVTGAEVFNQYTVGSIERGRRGLDQQGLLAIATALKLTGGERREFFLAASGVNNEMIAPHDTDTETVINHLLRKMEQLYLPCYLVDSYYDIVAASAAIIELLDLESVGLGIDSQEEHPFPNNILRFTFWDETHQNHLGKIFGQDWAPNVYQIMLDFRAISLRYRATRYFQSLMQVLKSYKQFRRLWREVYSDEGDLFLDRRDVGLSSPKWGAITYHAWHIPIPTKAGDLYLSALAPASSQTATTFTRIIDGLGPPKMIRIGHWPDKELTAMSLSQEST